MSNNSDDYQQDHANAYHQAVKRLNDENALREQRKAEWEKATGPKPTLDMFMGGAIRSDEEISALAVKIADQQSKQQSDMERDGLLKSDAKQTFEEKLRARHGEAEIERIREKQRQDQYQTRNQQQERGQD